MKVRFLSLLLLMVSWAGCGGGSPPDVPIRDLRPTQIERGDKVIVEASRPLFAVGAPTTVLLNEIHTDGGGAVTVPARAVGPTRVLFDADERFEKQIGAHLIDVLTTVTVEQEVQGRKLRYTSSPTDKFKLDLFPRSLHRMADRTAVKVTGGSLWSWLGLSVEEQPGVGLRITDIVARTDKNDLFRQYETAPIDGRITMQEARVGQPGGMEAAEFARLDHNHNQVLESAEFEELPEADGVAAAAGLRRGDVIVAAGGKPTLRPVDFVAAWQTEEPEIIVKAKRPSGTVWTDATVSLPRYGKPAGIPDWVVWALFMALAAGIVALPVPVIGGLVVVWERKVSAYMQSRIGPNRVGPAGWLQWLADGLKLLMKEDVIPTDADPILFRIAPYLAFVGVFLVFMVIPFSGWFIVADLNIGLLFLLSVTSLVVVSIIMGGWSSNSKWSLLGGMRSAAQIISYELPASVALLSIATQTGSLSTVAIVRAQGGLPWDWYVFNSPFTFCAFFIYFISALAEGNRTPFDLPEAESELVAGYFTEYSGFRFSLFPLVEWVNVFVIAAVTAMLFLGGWNIPGLTAQQQDANGWLQAAGFGIFLVKIIALIFVIIWIRWTLPRFRVDQMMNLCWKYFIPISFACFLGMLMWTWLLPQAVQYYLHFVWFFGLGLLPLFLFVKRVQYNRSRYRDLNLQQAQFS